MKKLVSLIKLVAVVIVCVCLFILIEVSDVNRTKPMGLSQTDNYASKYIYMIERGTGETMYEKNAGAKAFPASLTKIMTTIVALENIQSLSAKAPIDVATYHDMVARNASMAGFLGRETVTYRDLLYGTMLSSGGEASNSLAIHTAGSTKQFVQLMNEKAAELGMKDTHFVNPEGLHDPEQYTTARDMAKLLDYALANQNFKAIFTKRTFQTSPTADHPSGLTLHSTVLSTLRAGEQNGFTITGGKSGTTYEAGQCWATLGESQNREYITIVMGAPLEHISRPDFAQKQDTLELFATVNLED